MEISNEQLAALVADAVKTAVAPLQQKVLELSAWKNGLSELELFKLAEEKAKFTKEHQEFQKKYGKAGVDDVPASVMAGIKSKAAGEQPF